MPRLALYARVSIRDSLLDRLPGSKPYHFTMNRVLANTQ